jgi:ribose 5-phosphate isomerase RpiB
MSRAVVTAQMLQEMLATRGPIELPRDALITPAARDWLRDRKIPITWQDAKPSAGVGGRVPIVIDLKTPMLRSLLITLERILGSTETIDPSEKAGGMVAAVRTLCAGVAAGQYPRGIVFADDGNLPVCVANKCRGIRAALGLCLPSVEQAVRQFAANVLVIEPAHQTMHQIRQMVQRFVTLRASDSAKAALDAIAAMEMEGAAGANR